MIQVKFPPSMGSKLGATTSLPKTTKAGGESTAWIFEAVSEPFESMAVLSEMRGWRKRPGWEGSRSHVGLQAGIVDICASVQHRCCGNSPQSYSALKPPSTSEAPYVVPITTGEMLARLLRPTGAWSQQQTDACWRTGWVSHGTSSF